ncbi:MAG: DnaJ family domain-containing protein [Pseudomonadota bacterium]
MGMLKLDSVKATLLRWRAARRRDAAAAPEATMAGGGADAALQLLARRRRGPGPGVRQVDDEIARQLADAERRGELRRAQGYGQPLAEDAGWQQTPDEVRMPFKMLKSAGIVPHEVELLRERAVLRARLAAATSPEDTRQAQQALAELELALALRLESLRR